MNNGPSSSPPRLSPASGSSCFSSMTDALGVVAPDDMAGDEALRWGPEDEDEVLRLGDGRGVNRVGGSKGAAPGSGKSLRVLTSFRVFTSGSLALRLAAGRVVVDLELRMLATGVDLGSDLIDGDEELAVDSRGAFTGREKGGMVAYRMLASILMNVDNQHTQVLRLTSPAVFSISATMVMSLMIKPFRSCA